jgi:alpha-L-fucosidase 2
VTVKPVKSLHVRVHALTAQTETAEAWGTQLEGQRATVEAVSFKKSRKQHEDYWTEFWSRSHLFVSGTPEAERVSQAYVLQRWIQSCAGRGGYPIKFNGSLFTVDGLEVDRKTKEVTEHGPDYRRWGGCYWFQNTREPYWAMLYSGDLDQMEPLWKMYRDALPLLKDRTQTYFKHDGIFCSETMHFWGLNPISDFGPKTEGVYPRNPWIRYYWDSGNELSMMMLDFYAHSQDEAFAKNTLIPIAGEVVKFYDQHYTRNEQGQVHFSPAMALETWHKAEDPLPIIVGLNTVLTGLLDLPETLTTPAQRASWIRFRSELPEIPVGEEGGMKWIKPARVFSEKKNTENPELYAVFPYRAYTVGKPDLEAARETWRRRLFKRTGGWTQDPIQAAMLGLTQEAKDLVVKNVTNRSPIGAPPVVNSRFPAFWGPNFDWTPDQCHGSVTMIALQRMLMLCDADSIRLLPAWPKEWNANFKLHAPYNTTVEGRVENGKVIDLKVTPESRRKDIVIEGI